MKYIKTYEQQKIVFNENEYLLITGNKYEIVKILEKFSEISKIKLTNIIETLTVGQWPNFDEYNDLLGIYIGNGKYGYGFFPIRKDKEKDGVEFYEGENFTYIGELKLIKDELILDTFDIDTKKYNI